jgi:hypothetical protein
MYAAHFAAGLAIKSRRPQVPTWAVLTAVFVPDLIWIVLAGLGVEPADRGHFFDDWSHSLAMTILWATLFAMLFWRSGRQVAGALWLAVFSHFLLDLPIHPKNLALYPHSMLHLGVGLAGTGRIVYWWVQLAVAAALCGIYVQGARRQQVAPNLVAAACLVVASLHLLMLL